ncbi:hypothetical protein EAX61_15195 [Dokdonia sinensis]|uniref:Fn3-like domain-containing protein n=1 Tax=Dokdonia sinensis TaxID=2479847 RepID=A0A3M0FUX4_9FLAO|nr:hypothetical protein [Dokdonia sinensis]RMB56295.1 hypothetical protein EAX61_15195 [Dokdonia sinensis]
MKINTQIIFTILFALTAIIVQAQDCQSSLSVEKNRSFKSVSNYGTVYNLLLRNDSNQKSTFQITAKQLTTTCGNKKQVSLKPNAKVDITFLDNRLISIKDNRITVPGNTTINLKAKIKAPKGTPVNTWGCVEVQVANVNCKSISSSTILSAWILDPSASE